MLFSRSLHAKKRRPIVIQRMEQYLHREPSRTIDEDLGDCVDRRASYDCVYSDSWGKGKSCERSSCWNRDDVNE